MLEALFLRLLPVSFCTGLVAVAVRLLAPRLNGAYAARWKYWLWLVLALRLLVFFPALLPKAPVQIPLAGASRPLLLSGGGLTSPLGPPLPSVLPAPSGDVSASSGLTLLGAASVLWLAGAALFLVWQLTRYFLFRRTALRWALPPPAALQEALAREGAALGLRRLPAFYCSSGVNGPLVIGFLRPALFLPREDYAPQELSFILRHELTHCRRGDVWYKLVLLLARALHWFNPAVHLLAREAAADLERCCDEAVARDMPPLERRAYTEIILTAAAKKGGQSPLSTAFQGSVRALRFRLLSVLQAGKKRRGLPALAVACLLAVLLGGLVACTAPQTGDELFRPAGEHRGKRALFLPAGAALPPAGRRSPGRRHRGALAV